ncbi:MAG TPA: nickel pincer cofactor biosynthesis protein LarB [Candidatus Eisenbacteria bacterium]|nr:nickel pincer cofactor biosynthesis protein LarB [Candidatus Eisenbacteria bacterium]
MDRARLRRLLGDVRRGRLSPSQALDALTTLPFETAGDATIDHHRGLRQHLPEVILCEGKTVAQCVAIARAIVARSGRCLATRAKEPQARALIAEFGEAARWNETARAVVLEAPRRGARRGVAARPGVARRGRGGSVLVISAGTSDAPVAEEAVVTLEFMGVPVTRVSDAGVAGIHRLLSHLPSLREASAVVVVAGMEGALASVVGGLTDRPVIAVPTSVGYGASFGGLAALLGMLNACAAGVTVVNIDNGFGAGYAAGVIAGQSRPARAGAARAARARRAAPARTSRKSK